MSFVFCFESEGTRQNKESFAKKKSFIFSAKEVQLSWKLFIAIDGVYISNRSFA